MRIIYARESLTGVTGPSLFLAGPTPRSNDVASWRPDALTWLEASGFEGTVLVPESRDGSHQIDYLDQVEWEWAGLEAASVIVFWVPRALPDMPAFTTNAEFGLYARSGRVVFGAPLGAVKVRYLQWCCGKLGIDQHDNLAATLTAAVAKALT